MANILIRFWLKRFALIFVLACVGLSAIELLQNSGGGFSYATVFGWSATAALFASSLATYWAYKKQCKVVFKDGSGGDAAQRLNEAEPRSGLGFIQALGRTLLVA